MATGYTHIVEWKDGKGQTLQEKVISIQEAKAWDVNVYPVQDDSGRIVKATIIYQHCLPQKNKS